MNLKNMESTEYQKGEKLSEFGVMTEPAKKSIMVNNLHWQRWCPDCKEWFDIRLKPPGTKTARGLPCYCKVCMKIRNDKRPVTDYYSPVKIIKKKLKPTIKKKVDKVPATYENRLKSILSSGSFKEFMEFETRPNPYDDNDDWKAKRQKL